jgi:hypothetical protein
MADDDDILDTTDTDQPASPPDSVPEQQAPQNIPASAPPAPAAISAPAMPATNSQDDDEDDEDDDNEPQGQSQGQQASATAPTSNQAPLANPGQVIDQVTNPTVDELNDEHLKTAQDLASGKIKPKTYADLFGDNSTAGKFGLAFSILAGGIGSGLTHQPNAALTMMDKIIDRDMQSQQQSKEDANNFLRTGYEHQSQVAQQKLWEAQRNGINISNQDIMAHKANLEANTALVNTNNAKARTILGLLNQAGNTANGLPPGQQKQQADAAVNMMDQHFIPQIQQNNADTVSKLNTISAMRNPQQTSNNQQNPAQSEQQFAAQQQQYRLAGLDNVADSNEAKHMPGVGNATINLSPSDRDQITKGMSFQNQLQGFINWSRYHEGSVNPAVINQGTALAAQLQSSYRDATNGGVYKEGEQNFINKIISNNPTAFFNEVRNTPQLLGIQRETKAGLNQFLKSKAFPNPNPVVTPTWEAPTQNAQAQGASNTNNALVEGSKGVYQGKPYTVKNGQAVVD